jgi:hypothetical protein
MECRPRVVGNRVLVYFDGNVRTGRACLGTDLAQRVRSADEVFFSRKCAGTM